MAVLDLFRLDGKVAVVTGGNRGLGEAFARALGEAGARVAIAARDHERSPGAAAAPPPIAAPDPERSGDVAAGLGALAVSGDVTDTDSVGAMLATVPSELGP